MKTLVEACGRQAKEFSWRFKDKNLKSLDLMEVLNLMPNMEKLMIGCDREIKSYQLPDTSKRLKLDDKLKLPKLTTLHIDSSHSTIIKFLAVSLRNNQIISLGYERNVDENLLRELFSSQQLSIKKVMVQSDAGCLKALQLLTLEELFINLRASKNINENINLQAQQELKVLTIWNYGDKLVEEICELKKLENLRLENCGTFTDLSLIQKLPKLKKLNLMYANLIFAENLSFENLQELDLFYDEVNNPEVLDFFPNVKDLRVKTMLKVNSFAKFPKLEKLRLRYESDRNVEIYEVDTGPPIVHQNLKVLEIHGRLIKNFWKCFQNLSELHEVFPNLEKLNTDILKDAFDWSVDGPALLSDGTNFFANFGKFENLKTLTVEEIPIKHCAKIFEDIAEELVKLAQQIEEVRFSFEDRIELDDNWESFSYQNLIDGVQEKYEIFEDEFEDIVSDFEGNSSDAESWKDERNHMRFTLQITSKKIEDDNNGSH